MPVTMPEREPIATIVGALLVHTPPATVSVSIIESFKHTVSGPVIAVGDGLTCIIAVAEQPVGNV